MGEEPIPQLTTTGQIARRLGQPLHRVQYVLRNRPNIQPSAKAGIYRLYDSQAVEQVRVELENLDGRKRKR